MIIHLSSCLTSINDDRTLGSMRGSLFQVQHHYSCGGRTYAGTSQRENFLGAQGKAHRYGYSPITIIILANWDWTAMRVLISLWWLGTETGSKNLRSSALGNLFFKQELVTQCSRLGSQYTDKSCSCPELSLAQILAPRKSLFSNVWMDTFVSKQKPHYSACA